jgi:SAM-dependent methyltransferase
MPANHFRDDVAASYDSAGTGMFAPAVVDPAADFLAGLARQADPGAPSALEFAIGTGRIALPLSRRGVDVAGIDLSDAMLARLKAKPGADRITAIAGDFATAGAGRTFGLVYLVWNTIENLTSQDAQVDAFRNAAAHLSPGGHFVIEVQVPGLRKLPPGQAAVPFAVDEDRLGFDEYDPANQGLVSHHHWRDAEGTWHARSIPFRYVWPAELDLMARLAGLTRTGRWADWDRSPFTAASAKHVSAWRKP